jgi:hypothetical protein
MAAFTIKTNDTTNVTRVGSGWLSQTGFYSTSQWYANSGDTTIYNQWRAQGLTPGLKYTIAAFYKFDITNRSTVSRYAAIDSDGTTVLATRYVNQRHIPDAFTYDGVAWRGLFNVAPSGTTLYIRLYGDNGLTANYVIADGVYLQTYADGVPGGVPFSINDGNWSNADTWASGVIPGSSTPLTNIYTGVNVDVDTIAGTSGVVGTVAIDVKRETGILTINDDRQLTARGNIRLSQAQVTVGRTDGRWPFQIGQGITGGGKLKFDSSLAADPANTYYEVIAGGSSQPDACAKARGTTANPAQILSDPGGANGDFGIGAFTAGVGSVDFKDTVLTRIGNTTRPAISYWPTLAGSTLALENVTFNDCGQAVNTSATPHASTHLLLRNVLTTGTTSATGFSMKLGSSTPTDGTFLRVVENLRTDKVVQFSPATGLAVTNSALQKYTIGTGTTALWQYNFTASEVIGPDEIQDGYHFVDTENDPGNAHVIGSASVVRSVFDCPKSTNGEMFIHGNNVATEVQCVGNLMLPNAIGTSPGVLIVSQTKLATIKAEHNTIISTYGASANAETGITTVGETFEGLGGVSSHRSNLVYSPSGKGLFFSRRNTNVMADSLLAANAGYNAGNNLVTTTGAGTKAVFGEQGGYVDTAAAGLTIRCTGTAGSFTVRCYKDDGSTYAETGSIAYNAAAATVQAAVLAAFNTLSDGTYAGGTPTGLANSSTGTAMALTRNGVAFSYDRIGAALRPGGTNTTAGYVFTSQPMYTSTPTGLGATDLTVPGLAFVDTTRNLATFDRAYLGNTAVAAWADATAYAVGDIRSASDAGAFGGATINYRCISAHTSSAADGTNGKPNTTTTGTAWRTRWEYAGTYRLLSSLAVYTPGVPQATPRDLIEWVKAGWRPTTFSIATAAHDGTTIGAMPYFDGGGTPTQFQTVTFDAGFSSMTGGYDS